MFDFIWHLRGSIELRGTPQDEGVLIRLEQLLDEQRKSPERGPSSLYFEAPLWNGPFTDGWRSMTLYDRGRFWIEQGYDSRRLRYDLRSLHALVFCLVGATTFFFLGLAADGLTDALKWSVAVFAWLYGMNILLALARVPRAIRNAARGH
jgi:hypothetical protein